MEDIYTSLLFTKRIIDSIPARLKTCPSNSKIPISLPCVNFLFAIFILNFLQMVYFLLLLFCLLLHGIKGFVIPTKSFVKIEITKMFCYNNKMFSSINKTFGCSSKIFGCSNKKFICCP